MLRPAVALALLSLLPTARVTAQEGGQEVFCLALSILADMPPASTRVRVFAFTADNIPPEVPEYWLKPERLSQLPVKFPNALGFRGEEQLVVGIDMPESGVQMTLLLREEGRRALGGTVGVLQGSEISSPPRPWPVVARRIDCREMGYPGWR
jgi:hypothetical protein